MNHSALDILQRLLCLRQRKERRLRQQLFRWQQQQQQQELQLIQCRRERHQLCQQLQQLAQWRGRLLPAQAEQQRVLQHQMYQAERQQQKQISALHALGLQQQDAIAAQQALIRSNQREQEKLRMLIKDESNRY